MSDVFLNKLEDRKPLSLYKILSRKDYPFFLFQMDNVSFLCKVFIRHSLLAIVIHCGCCFQIIENIGQCDFMQNQIMYNFFIHYIFFIHSYFKTTAKSCLSIRSMSACLLQVWKYNIILECVQDTKYLSYFIQMCLYLYNVFHYIYF